jgi:hypothetical protein
MPFVGKNLKTLEFQRQRYLDELNQKSKNRIYFAKNKQHTKDTGSSLIAGRRSKTTLEQYLDASKVDINLEDFLIKELATNPGQAKIFIQGLDDTLKRFLLDRLPAFKKVFNDNFTVSSATNLKSAFELFNRNQLDKVKDIDIPTRSDLNDYLEDLFIGKVVALGSSIYQAQQEKVRRIPPRTAMNDYYAEIDRIESNSSSTEDADLGVRRYVSSIIIAYIRTFENTIDGWMASYQIAKNNGLRDFPKPKLETLREGIPTSTINLPISTIDLGSSDYNSPRSSLSSESSEEKDSFLDTPRREFESKLSEEGREILRRARRKEGIEGSGYNTPGFVKIYKLKK